jgi:7-keto-8-aminopelargonate synthetase-like enzyme
MSRNNGHIPTEALHGSLRDFRRAGGRDLLARCNAFYQWQNLRRRTGTWPFSRATEAGPATFCTVRDDTGRAARGVNFASQDYLSLSGHPEIKAAAHAAVEAMGVHSAGSSALLGNTSSSVALERRLASFLGMEEALLFPTGWAAGFGVIKALVKPSDFIVMDALAHACLIAGAQSATRNLVLYRHLSVEHCRQRLAAIRARNPGAGILLVTESLFSMDSDTPDIAALQDLARTHGATLMVDVAHDLGCLGADGTGHIGIQNMLGHVDIVMGSFSKTFASNGGFVAMRDRAVKEYIRYYNVAGTFSNALSPVQSAVVTKALDIVQSAEGAALRRKLMANVCLLRDHLRQRGMAVHGDPSAIVAVRTGNEGLSRLAARELPALGLIANLVEFPAVARDQARFRLQVMAMHTDDDVAAAADRMGMALAIARGRLEAMAGHQPGLAAAG